MFSANRLRQARELRLLTQTDLARRIGKSQATVGNIEGYFTLPSPELVASLAMHTRFPLAFFSTEPSVIFPMESLMFRSRASTTRREAVAACRYAEIEYETVGFLSKFVNPIPVRLQKSPLPQHPHIAAQQTRRLWGIPPDIPIEHLIHEIEKCGVIVLAVPFDLTRIDAFSAWVDEPNPKPVIAICSGRPGDRLRWNVAHELGHLILHWNVKPLQKEQHAEADRFAAEFLLPEQTLRREIVEPVTLSALAPLKLKWKVSIQALVRRAYDLSIITKRHYSYLCEQLSARGWRLKEPENLDIAIEKPRLLTKMAELAFGDPPDINRIAAETRLSPAMIREMLSGYDVITSEGGGEAIYSNKVIRFAPKL